MFAKYIIGIRWLSLWLGLLFAVAVQAAEVIPPKPDKYFNDYASAVSSSTAQRLNQRLAEFERETSNQILVAIFPKMQSDSDVADYTQRVAQSWGVGQKDKNNGAVLFVFKEDRKMFLQVGYGLEGVLPDALAKRIIEDEIKPHFKSGNFDAGVSAGVEAILKATRGEYKGTGRTVRESRQNSSRQIGVIVFLVVFFLMAFSGRLPRRGRYYRSSGYGWSGGWSSSGGSSRSSGGFSGGGGSFGGGGAGGSW